MWLLTTRPTVNESILAVNNDINYASDVIGLVDDFYLVGTRNQITGETIVNPTAMAKMGDVLWVTADIKINDSIFLDVDVSADFSQFAGSGYEDILPDGFMFVAGNIKRATWIFTIPTDVVDTDTRTARVAINVTNPIGFNAINPERETVPMVVDNLEPDVSASIVYYQGTPPDTDDFDPVTADQINPSQGDFWASMVVCATFTDVIDDASPINGITDGFFHGFAGGIFSAFVDNGNVIVRNNAGSAYPTVLFTEAPNEWFALVDPAGVIVNTVTPTFWAISDRCGVWSDTGTGSSSTDGPIVVSASDYLNDQAAIDLIRWSTNWVITIWYGYDPRTGEYNDTMMFEDNPSDPCDLSKGAVAIIASITDVIGNAARITAPNSAIEVDVCDPMISCVTVDICTGVPWLTCNASGMGYQPALYAADGTIIRPTRVGPGARLTIEFGVNDRPDPTDPIWVELDLNELCGDIDDLTLFTPNAFTQYEVREDDHVIGMIIDPTVEGVGGDLVIPVSGCFIVGDCVTTNPYTLASYMAAIAPQNYGLHNLAAAVVNATDTANNKATERDSNEMCAASYYRGVEVDNQGPGIIDNEWAMLVAPDEAAVDSIATIEPEDMYDPNRIQVANALCCEWLIFAATIVVDGTEDAQFPLDQFNVNWEMLEQDRQRLVRVNGVLVNKKGKQTVIASATRTILFVTNAVQVTCTCEPHDPIILTMTMHDFFCNETELRMDDGAYNPQYGYHTAIRSRGALASQVTLYVDDKVETVVGPGRLGIGQRVDSIDAEFEICPGAVVIVEATITTQNLSDVPHEILLDASDLYPPCMKALVDELIPNESMIIAPGTVWARWETIFHEWGTFDPILGVWTAVPVLTNMPAGIWQVIGGQAVGWFWDKGNIDYNLGIAPPGSGIMDIFANNYWYNAMPSGLMPSPVPSSGPASPFGVNPAFVTCSAGMICPPTTTPTMNVALNSIVGLPNMAVQKGAIAKNVAWMTVTVRDPRSLFQAEESFSSKFTVDTEPPRAMWAYDPLSIVRALDSVIPDIEEFPAGPRIGFPSAPNIDLNVPAGQRVPNRIRVGDAIEFIVDVTNELIDGTGDDFFTPLVINDPCCSTRKSVFTMDQAIASDTILEMTVDLTDFSTDVGMENLYATKVSSPQYLEIWDQGVGVPHLIEATFFVVATGDLGRTAIESKQPGWVWPTLHDDVCNIPRNHTFDCMVLGLYNELGLSVDNTGPAIHGSVESMLISGDVTDEHGIPIPPGGIIPPGSTIEGGAVLDVTMALTDIVDHPLDVLLNPNYGGLTFNGWRVLVPPANIVRSTEDLVLASQHSILVKYRIQMPDECDTISTNAFGWIMRASDTIGNTRRQISDEKFKFNGAPDLQVQMPLGVVLPDPADDMNYGPVVVTVNATEGAAVSGVVDATAMDLGGVTSILWDLTTTSPGVTLNAVDSDGADHADLAWAIAPPRGNAELHLEVMVPVSVEDATPVVGLVIADDVDGCQTVRDVTINLNQPPIIADALIATLTSSAGLPSQSSVDAPPDGIGYDVAFADIREVTIEEGQEFTLDIVATDANPGDPIAINASGSALGAADVIGSLVPIGNGESLFNFVPGYLAVSGAAESASFVLNVSAEGTNGIAPDTMRLVVNVLAMSATPELIVVRQTSGGFDLPVGDIEIPVEEGNMVEIVLYGRDFGLENLLFSTNLLPEDLPLIEVTDAFPATPRIAYVSWTTIGQGELNVTFRYTSVPEDADVHIIGYDGPYDPFTAQFVVQNASAEAEVIRLVDILNANQAPIVLASGTVDADTPVILNYGDTLPAYPGSTVVIDMRIFDPDGDDLRTQEPTVTLPAGFTSDYQPVSLPTFVLDAVLTIGIPPGAPIGSVVTIQQIAQDDTGKIRVVNYSIVVEDRPVVVTVVEEPIITQGPGGEHFGNVRNFDPSQDALTAILAPFNGVQNLFLAEIGGGLGRAMYTAAGDVDDDGDVDVIVTHGATTVDSPTPNIVIPRDARDGSVTGHSFVAFRPGVDAINLNSGEVRSAVGNFIGSPTSEQIAVAQGIGGNHRIRIYQDTGLPAPNGYGVVGQFTAAPVGFVNNNANGGIVLAAGDLDGDGVDELVVAQTNSETSRTQFVVLDIAADGSVARMTTSTVGAFPRNYQGNGGLEASVGDVNGDGINEIVFASAGNTRDFVVDEDGRNTAASSIITVVFPTVLAGEVQQFTAASRMTIVGGGDPVWKLLTDAENPSGAMSVSMIELNGDNTDGAELIVASGAVYAYDADLNRTDLLPAPQSLYRILKLDFVGTELQGVSAAVQGIAGQFRRDAFSGATNPSSGAAYLSAADTHP